MKVTHITTHMGGGIGRALSDLVLQEHEFTHRIIVLQQPEKDYFVNKCVQNEDVQVFICPSYTDINNLLDSSDVVVLHWWHHPAMCEFLYNFPKKPVRLVLWSHVSGCTYPFLAYDFTQLFEGIIRTSNVSLENPFWSERQKKEICEKSELVYGLGELGSYDAKKSYKESGDFKIGYVGTLAESKIHPAYVKICRKIVSIIPNVKFYLVGDKDAGVWMEHEIEEYNLEDYIEFVGYVDHVDEWLQKFDIFGYPLNSYNYATTENSILEAMAVGLPVVLLNQGTEKYIVQHNINGVLANDIDDYVDYMVALMHDSTYREKLGKQARKDVYVRYDFNNNLNRFRDAIRKVKSAPKAIKAFKNVIGSTPYEWWISAMNDVDKDMIHRHAWSELQPIFREKKKSSVYHFADSYLDDIKLKTICDELNKGESRNE